MGLTVAMFPWESRSDGISAGRPWDFSRDVSELPWDSHEIYLRIIVRPSMVLTRDCSVHGAIVFPVKTAFGTCLVSWNLRGGPTGLR